MAKRDAGHKRLSRIERNLKNQADELSALYQVSRSITSSSNLDRVLDLIARKVGQLMKADVSMIYLIEDKAAILKAAYGLRKGMGKPRRPIPLGILKEAVSAKRPVKIDGTRKNSSDPFCSLCKRYALHSTLVVPILERGKVLGLMTVCTKKRSAYTKEDEKELALFAGQAALAIENACLLEETKIHYLNTMKLLASVIDAKDTGTEDHSESVMRSAMGIARALGLSDKQKSVIRHASLLHDVGKIGIDISILRKPAPLTAKEWMQMKTHPKVGADILSKAGFLDELIPAILYHHVRYAGGGYPATKKKGSGIPLEARILSVADAYESMRSDRPYRKHLTREEAIAELKRCSGTQFDPKVVKAFLKHLNR